MAYISTIKNREGVIRVYLKESYRENDKVKKRTLYKFGKLDDLIKENPNALEDLKLQAKNGYFDYLKPNIQIDVKLDPNKPREQCIYNYGYLLLQEIYDNLGISKVVKNFDKKNKNIYSLNEVLKLLVYSRIIYPSSKLGVTCSQKKFLGEYNYNYNHIIRSLDYITKIKEDIQLQIHNAVSDDIGRSATLVFYDVTNYYFETDFNDEDYVNEHGDVEEALRKRGPSKEKRPNPIVQMGMFMDSNGIPISYKLFPGNRTDPVTYIPAIEQVKKQFGIERIITVADKAMNSSKNVTDANTKGDGWLFSQKIRGSRGVAKELQFFALDKSGWKFNEEKTFGMKSMIRKRKLSNKKTIKEKVVVTYNQKYAMREKIRRNGALEYANKLTNAELFRITSKKGGKRYLVQKVKDPLTGELVEMNPFIGIDFEQVREDELYDGINVLVTSEVSMKDEEVIHQYHQLTHIEECFRKTKTELDTRPIYVRNDSRIEAHFLTCYIALTMLKILEHKTNHEISSSKIIEALRDSNAIKITGGYYKLDTNENLKKVESILGCEYDKQYIKHEELFRYYNKTVYHK